MNYLLTTARTYAMLYKVTNQKHYLLQAWECLARVKALQDVTRTDIKLKLVG